MIHAVTVANQHLYAGQLDQMFRMRHEYYVLGHGWDAVTGQDGRETDEFDDESAVYLLAVDAFGDVAASLRLNPCAGPTLLKKLQGEYCPGAEAASDPAAWDLSRWIARPEDRRGNGTRWKTNFQRELMIGLLEFCERRGITRLTMLAELRLAERIQAYGWPVRYLGEPRAYEGGKGVAVAAEIETGLHVMILSRQKTGVLGAVLTEVVPGSVPPQSDPALSPELVEAVAEIGVQHLTRLARAMGRAASSGMGDETVRAIEFVGALNRILESMGGGLEGGIVRVAPGRPDAHDGPGRRPASSAGA